MMHSDLTLEALFRLSRRKAREGSIPQISLKGLDHEHLELAQKAGWVRTRPGADGHTIVYVLTDAGQQHLDHLVAHSRLQALSTSF